MKTTQSRCALSTPPSSSSASTTPLHPGAPGRALAHVLSRSKRQALGTTLQGGSGERGQARGGSEKRVASRRGRGAASGEHHQEQLRAADALPLRALSPLLALSPLRMHCGTSTLALKRLKHLNSRLRHLNSHHFPRIRISFDTACLSSHFCYDKQSTRRQSL